MQERLNSFAERPWILLPVAALGYLWIVLGLSAEMVFLIGTAAVLGVLALAALGDENECRPFPVIDDILIGVILSTWATFILRSFFGL